MKRHKEGRFQSLFGRCILPCYDHVTPQVGYKIKILFKLIGRK
jgi:hypothetical protein